MSENILNEIAPNGLIASLIGDAIAIGSAYIISFIGCDIIYNDFSLSQSIKSAYWFFLGPFLWRWGTAIPWVFEILKNFLKGKWDSIKDSFLDWIKGSLPSWIPSFLVIPPMTMIADITDLDGPQMIDNYKYIQSIHFQGDQQIFSFSGDN